MKELYTPWGETIDRACPLPEYPRPQLVRDSYLCLNGLWDYTVQDGEEYTRRRTGKILVPFSPESLLSGCDFQLQSGETLWYERTFTLPEGFRRARVLLHFGAVDQCSRVLVNDRPAGHHEGGYLPFCMDITELLVPGENRLTVAVTDDAEGGVYAFGKQRYRRGGIWYTATSGIWQTVWLESVPENYIKNIRLTPDFDEKCLLWHIDADAPAGAHVTVRAAGAVIAEGRADEKGDGVSAVPAECFHPWSPEDPYLYDVEITLGDDRVTSYFGMRKFSTVEYKGRCVLALNNEPYFQTGLLDQGYWSDGLYTPPSDAAVVHELQTIKELGFNLLRKHAKIEPQRWYYHCDKLGLIVWQDMVNGGEPYRLWFVTYLTNVLQPLLRKLPDTAALRGLLSRRSEASREEYGRELEATVEALRGHPCIGCWVPFNEGWGQFDAAQAVETLRALDPDRLVDEASGWYDQGGGDVDSRHNYFYPLHLRPGRRTVALSEYGGIAWPMPGHEPPRRTYGYGTARSRAELTGRYRKLQLETVLPQLRNGLSALVYTQVSDVEDEVNGLFTYDRQAVKPDPAAVRAVNEALEAEFEKVLKQA